MSATTGPMLILLGFVASLVLTVALTNFAFVLGYLLLCCVLVWVVDS
jgi:hypothetical protein